MCTGSRTSLRTYSSARKAAHLHTHGEVRPFDMRRADVRYIGVALIRILGPVGIQHLQKLALGDCPSLFIQNYDVC